MKIDFNNIKEQDIEGFKGGTGSYHVKMFDYENTKIMLGTLKKGDSIGLHTHENNAEIIYVLSGIGTCIYDGEEITLYSGDAHLCPEGHSHTLINKEAIDLVFFAVVK